MSSLFAQSELKDLIEKVERDERLDFKAGLRMMNSPDILALGYMANLVRERKNGNQTYFTRLGLMNYTDVWMERSDHADLTEIHLIGEFNSELPFEYYLEILQKVKQVLPRVNVQAFTAREIDSFVQMTHLSTKDILLSLMDAGLDSLSGSRAEVFSPLDKAKLNGADDSEEGYLKVQEAAHRLGMRTNATMTYGSVESNEERIIHLLKLRELQDRTGGFQAFLPLSYLSQEAPLVEGLGNGHTTGFDDLKILSIARILLDNFDHIKVLSSALGPKLTQVSLNFGVDHLYSYNLSERVMKNLIEKAGRKTCSMGNS